MKSSVRWCRKEIIIFTALYQVASKINRTFHLSTWVEVLIKDFIIIRLFGNGKICSWNSFSNSEVSMSRKLLPIDCCDKSWIFPGQRDKQKRYQN